MFAKRLFYASAAILCFAIAYHLGAGRAVAQSATLQVGESGLGLYAGAIGRTVFLASASSGSTPLDFFRSFPAVPGSSPILAISATGNISYPATVMLENGDVYVATGNGSSWNLAGNILNGAPTPAQRTSLGALKVKYR